MKIVRFFTFLIVAILVFSAWTPVPVFAKPGTGAATIAADSVSANIDLAAAKLVKLTIINKTNGTLYVSLTGQRAYSFVLTNQGKSRYDIEAGKYTFVVRSSACPGSYSKSVNFKGNGTIGPIVCLKK
jgi:hypothetical protein